MKTRLAIFFLFGILFILIGRSAAQDTPLTQHYESNYYGIRFDYPADWSIRESLVGVQLLNYNYDMSKPNHPGEARMEFITAEGFVRLGLAIDTADPVDFLDAIRPIFHKDTGTQEAATAISLGEFSAARADGTFLNNQTIFWGISNASGDLLFITGEAAPDEFSSFEPLFLQIAATAAYTAPQFADPLPTITAENAAQIARYFQFDTSQLPSGQTEQVVFSPDGSLAANVLGIYGVQIWDANTGELLHNLVDLAAYQVAFSADNSQLVAVSFDPEFQSIDLSSEAVSAVPADENLRAIAYSLDGSYIATGSQTGIVIIWDTETEEILQTLPQLSQTSLESLSFSPDGALLVSPGNSAQVRLWDVEGSQQGQLLSLGDASLGDVQWLAFSQDGSRLAALTNAGNYAVFEVSSGNILLSGSYGESLHESAIAMNSDGSLVAIIVPPSGAIDLIDTATGTSLVRLSQGGDNVSGLAFSPDGSRLLSGGFNQDTLVMWAISQ